jgi:hypothetical protein
VGEQLVEVDFAEDGAQRGLGELRGLVDVVRDLDDGLDRVDHAQGDDGVDLEVTLSRVMTSCEGTSMASWRRETRTIWSMGRKTRMTPGPRRPRGLVPPGADGEANKDRVIRPKAAPAAMAVPAWTRSSGIGRRPE